MAGLYEIEVEPEVRSWLAQLSDRDFGRVDFPGRLLAERAEDLGEPYTRHLGGKVRELRFDLLRQQTRVTYLARPTAAGDLTDRVQQDPPCPDGGGGPAPLETQKICEAEHGPAHKVFDREVT